MTNPTTPNIEVSQRAREAAATEREYRKIATIKAVQWWQIGDHYAVYLREPLGDLADYDGPVPWIKTLEGGHIVTPGDWIATGINGEHWPIKPDVFAKSYVPVEAEAKAETAMLREALEKVRDTLRSLQPALNVMARDIVVDIIADQIDAALTGRKSS